MVQQPGNGTRVRSKRAKYCVSSDPASVHAVDYVEGIVAAVRGRMSGSPNQRTET